MRAIAKMLMNSLYGRTGMKSSPDVIKFLDKDGLDQVLTTNNVVDYIKLDDDQYFVRYHKNPCPILCEQSDNDLDFLSYMSEEKDEGFVLNSTPIAAATAS